MKYLLALPLLLCSCVTSGDIRRIEDALADETKTVEEVQATVAEVADRVDERTEGFIEGIGNAGGAGTRWLDVAPFGGRPQPLPEPEAQEAR